MRTWFQCIGRFVKWNNHYYYVQERGDRGTLLVHPSDLHQFILNNYQFDAALANDHIELMAE